MDVLLVVDLQNDFVDGALGNEGNDKIVKPIEKLIEEALMKKPQRHHLEKEVIKESMYRIGG